MATVSFLTGNASFSTASGTKTTSSTATVGDLIVIVTAHSGNTSSATPTDNNPGGAGTYVKITSATSAAGVDTVSVFVRTALLLSGSSTTYSHAPGTSTGGGLVVYKVTGMTKTGAAAVIQSAVQNNQGAGGTPTPVLGAAAQTQNPLIGAVINATNPGTMTPRSSPAWTEGNDTGYITPTTGFESMSISSGETATSIAWGGTSASAFGSLVIELDAVTSRTYVPSGGMTFAGAAGLTKSKTFTPTGGVTLGGSSTNSKDKIYTPTGGLIFAGIAPRLKVKVPVISGGLVLAGTSGVLKSKSYLPSGGLVFAGFGVTSITVGAVTHTYLPTGGFRLSGDGSGVKTFVYSYGIGNTFTFGSDRRQRINWRR